MDESYSQWGERDPKEIQDAYGGFLEGVANVMSSTVLKRSGTATKGKDKADVSFYFISTLVVLLIVFCRCKIFRLLRIKNYRNKK